MTLFRPCIDIHGGSVKQIVGSSLSSCETALKTNYVSHRDAGYYARLYRKDNLLGGHVIMLGAGNEAAAQSALAAWPDGLHLGGGITPANAAQWIKKGAQKVIVTSWLFFEKKLDMKKVEIMSQSVGPERLVIDLSCRRTDSGWFVATDRWQTTTETQVTATLLNELSGYCSEYLIHAADVEGKCEGIDPDLVRLLGDACPIPCTYAGGARDISDLDTVQTLSDSRVDLTFGSALDLFGGHLVKYDDCVKWNAQKR
ncbi:MAG: phosphoribosylformimino-5-aminoimidazole carboxamide ribotide isomerase [Deltaproteobacteria bacterium]|nr:phosphoribosylformimino-5-aminoimidazole carboxamide ribotide isomerase [Deltaproteobacteria bacterium]